MIYAGVIILIIGAVLFIFAGKRKKTQGEMAKTKSIPINQLREGQPAEIQGIVASSQPMKTPFSKKDCVYYEYELERETQVKDQQGRASLRWETLSQDRRNIPFWIQDKTGQVVVYPEKADIDGQPLGEQFVQAGETLSNPLFRNFVNAISGFRTKVNEEALLVGSLVYVFGNVVRTDQGLAIQKGPGEYIISYKSEEQVEKAMGRSATAMKVLGIIGVIGGIILTVYSFL